jgi:hypothetical protein
MSHQIARNLKRFCESNGAEQTVKNFTEALEQKKFGTKDVTLGHLTRIFLGEDYLDVERKLRAIKFGQTHLLEAAEAVDASAFSNITGQLLVTVVKEKYNAATFIGDKLMSKFPNPNGNLQAHKVPYLSDVKDKGKLLAQLEPYPMTQFAESWITLPAPEKRGEICAISMEMAYSDFTGQAQDSAGSVGRAIAYLREERMLRVVLGIVNPYIWNDNALNTYVSTAGTGNYTNKLLSSTITNYTHVNSVEQLFFRMVDPITGRSITAMPNAVLCMPEKRYELKRVFTATEVRSGDITTGTGEQTNGANPLDIAYEIMFSPIARNLMDTETSLTDSQIKEFVIFGDFQKAFKYREVYPFRAENAPANNPLEFNQDIVLAVKAGEFGVPCVFDPRYVVQSTSEAS